jgi:hypothetical protein
MRKVHSSLGKRGDMQKVDPDTLNEIAARIDALTARPSRLLPAQVIERLAPSIDAALARGQNTDAIVSALKASGIKLSCRTVHNYLAAARKKRRTAAVNLVTCADRGATPRIVQVPAGQLPAAPRADGVFNTAPAQASGPKLAPGHFALIPDSEDL